MSICKQVLYWTGFNAKDITIKITLKRGKILQSQFGEKEAQQIHTEVEEINNYIESGEQRSESIHTLQLLNKARETLNTTPLIISPKDAAGQQKLFSTKNLNEESLNRVIEDWDLSPEELRDYSDDSLDLHYEDYYEMDNDILTSDEAWLPKTPRTSTPWKAQTRNIPPLYIPRK